MIYSEHYVTVLLHVLRNVYTRYYVVNNIIT